MNKTDSVFIKLLKENTTIDEDFINIFFKKFKIGGELDFDIKDIDVSKYLGISLITLRKRLNNGYSKTKRFDENVDYIRVRKGMRNIITYMLNYPCFEKIAMSSDSGKSEMVRMYFTKLREFITDNQYIIYQAITNNNDLKKYNGTQTIYFFAADERQPNILKPGRASKIVDRLRNYNVGRIKEIDLKYLALVKNPILIERCMNSLLARNKIDPYKEMVKIEPKTLKKVINDCYCRHVSPEENKELYEEISALLGIYVFVKDQPHVKPYIVIGENL